MPKKDTNVLQGTLDLLILRVLADGPRHGWALAKQIQLASRDVLRVNQGSLYPALYRLQDQGFLRSKLDPTPTGRSVRMYRLTGAGQAQLRRERRRWHTIAAAINHVLEPSG